MGKNNSLLAMSIIRFTLVILLAITPISCKLFSSSSHHYDNPAFSFDYPSDWQTMENLWGFQQLDENYYGLGLQEIIMITSVQKKGDFGAYFAVATKALPEGESLEMVFHQTYKQIEGEMREVSETTTTINGYPTLGMNYERPWGEPWWQFRDLWLEKDNTIYVLSFHCLGATEKYQEDLDLILNSFLFK